MNHLSLLVFVFYGLQVYAGGIGFENKYVGKHPFTDKNVTLEFKNRAVAIDVEGTLGHAEDLVLTPVTRNQFETIFDIQQGNAEGEVQGKAPVLAKLVTTGDCQRVQSAALVFPSGVTVALKATRSE